MKPAPICICGHRLQVAHPRGGECFESAIVDGKTKRCRCKKYVAAGEVVKK